MNHNQDKPLFGADNNALIALLSINLVIAAGLGFMKITYYLEGFPQIDFEKEIYQYVVLQPNNLKNTFWTIVSYNWTHDGFWTLFTNMFWLILFGQILQNKGYNKHLFPIYVYSGIVTAISYILMNGVYPLIGAQSSVFALAMASIILTPTQKLLPNIGKGYPVWMLVIIYGIVTTLSVTSLPIQKNIALLLAGFVGILYALLLKKEIDLGNWMHQLLHKINNSLTPNK